MTKPTTTPVLISERLRDYLHAFSPVVGITPETITVDQVPRWERVAAMVLRGSRRGSQVRRKALSSISRSSVRLCGPRGK